MKMNDTAVKKAILYRMVMEKHICPYGLKAKDLLQRKGFVVEDHWLQNREQVDLFKEKYEVKTTPQAFIDGVRIGGYDELRRYFGKKIHDSNTKSYRPVITLFLVTALIALAVNYSFTGTPFTTRSLSLFISISMVILALLKLQNIEAFSTMFLNYDLLAKRWVPYSYIYPFAEALAGILMISGAMNWISIPLALGIGTIGALSVFKAVYIDKRDLKCACVGGDSIVPLGFISLTENLMMIGMALTMCFM
jgi:glutaredoxin